MKIHQVSVVISVDLHLSAIVLSIEYWDFIIGFGLVVKDYLFMISMYDSYIRRGFPELFEE